MKRSFLTLIYRVVLVTGVIAQDVADTASGVQLYRLGKFAEAASVLEKVIEAGKSSLGTKLYLAAAYVHLGRKSEAVKLLRKANHDKSVGEKFDKPLKIIKRSTPPCADVYKNGFGSAITKVAVEYLGNGQIGLIIAFYTTAPPHDWAAADAVKKFTFDPATIGGQPVTTVELYTFVCELGD
jgi:hypothetical protein